MSEPHDEADDPPGDGQPPIPVAEDDLAREESALEKAREAEDLHRRLQGQGGAADDVPPAARERLEAVDAAYADAEDSARRGRSGSARQ